MGILISSPFEPSVDGSGELKHMLWVLISFYGAHNIPVGFYEEIHKTYVVGAHYNRVISKIIS